MLFDIKPHVTLCFKFIWFPFRCRNLAASKLVTLKEIAFK